MNQPATSSHGLKSRTALPLRASWCELPVKPQESAWPYTVSVALTALLREPDGRTNHFSAMSSQ